ncbi:unnamed protein product [Discula destructiva]
MKLSPSFVFLGLASQLTALVAPERIVDFGHAHQVLMCMVEAANNIPAIEACLSMPLTAAEMQKRNDIAAAMYINGKHGINPGVCLTEHAQDDTHGIATCISTKLAQLARFEKGETQVNDTITDDGKITGNAGKCATEAGHNSTDCIATTGHHEGPTKLQQRDGDSFFVADSFTPASKHENRQYESQGNFYYTSASVHYCSDSVNVTVEPGLSGGPYIVDCMGLTDKVQNNPGYYNITGDDLVEDEYTLLAASGTCSVYAMVWNANVTTLIGNSDVHDILYNYWTKADWLGNEVYGTWSTCSEPNSLTSWVIMVSASGNGK